MGGHPVGRDRRWQEVNNIDDATRCRAAEKRGARTLQHLNRLNAIKRVRQPVGLIAVGKPVGIDPRVETADGKTIEEAVGRGAANVDAADVMHDVRDLRAALFKDQRARNDHHALRQVGESRAGLAESRGLLQTARSRRRVAGYRRRLQLLCRGRRRARGTASPLLGGWRRHDNFRHAVRLRRRRAIRLGVNFCRRDDTAGPRKRHAERAPHAPRPQDQ